MSNFVVRMKSEKTQPKKEWGKFYRQSYRITVIKKKIINKKCYDVHI